MGLIKAVAGAIGGMFADQWLETIQPGEMDDKTIFVRGVKTRNDKRSSNTKATDQTVSNGSIIQVYDNQCMILTDGGKIVDFTTEPGAFKVDNSSSPSLFAGQFGEVLKDTFERFKFGGTPSGSQRVYYINLQEIKGIKFGTKSPISYFDSFYNAELFLRTFGSYSIKITDPLLFYSQAIPKNAEKVSIDDINEQYLAEFLTALQSAINRFSMEGIRVSHVPSKSMELSKYMAEVLDDDWKKLRGIEVLSVGIQSVSYDEESQKLINVRNQGAMLSDPTIREGYVQGSVARGMEAAGSNSAGAMTGFAGIGMGMNSAGGFMASASQANVSQMQANAMQQNAQKQTVENEWTCSCGEKSSGKFCPKCGKPKPQNETWLCSCGTKNSGKFCSECGKPKPQNETWTCSCGAINKGKFCSECGKGR